MRKLVVFKPTGKSVSDGFKGQTMGSIIKVIRHSFRNL